MATGAHGDDLTAHAGTWALDPARTSAEFRTKAMWVLPVKGTMRAVEGSAVIGADGSVSGTLVLDAASIATGMAKRDTHLRSADFLDTDRHPSLTFTASGARAGTAGLEVSGTLTAHGVTRPIAVPVEVTVDGDVATVHGAVEVDRGAWGMTWTRMGAGLHNAVTVDAVFTRA